MLQSARAGRKLESTDGEKKSPLALLLCVAVMVGAGTTARDAPARGRQLVRVSLGSRVVGHFRSNSIRVRGLTARAVGVRLIGATDMSGRAYQWAPYRWRPLRLRRGTWRGELPAPVLFGIYQLQLRLDHGRKLLTDTHWLERVFPYATEARRSFPTPGAVIHDYVAHLPGHQILVATRPWPLASYDHRNPRLHRLFAIAYAPRGRPGRRLGRFISTVREGFTGRWRLLQVATQPLG